MIEAPQGVHVRLQVTRDSKVLETTVAADLDATYLRVLTGVVGIDQPVARNVVEDVAAWRQHARQDSTEE